MNRREVLQAMCVGAAGALGAFASTPASPDNLTDVDLVPDTLNLEDHARLSLNYLKGMLDESGISARNGRPVGFPLFNAMFLLDPSGLRNFAGSTKDQKLNLAPSWMIRGSLAPCTVPIVGEPRFVSTLVQFVWLNTLKNSNRN
jgi:hypothetical protein